MIQLEIPNLILSRLPNGQIIINAFQVRVPFEPDSDTVHFKFEFADNDTYSSPIYSKDTSLNQSGVTLLDGNVNIPFPAAGVSVNQYAEQPVTFTASAPLIKAIYFYRVTATSSSAEVGTITGEIRSDGDITIDGGFSPVPVTITNVGSGVPLYRDQVGNDFRFKTMRGQSHITVVGTGNEVLVTDDIVFGNIAGSFTQGNDSRLSDARTPTAHAPTHSSSGSDPITVINLAGNLTQARSHDSADTDASASAIHHTLGSSGSQACAGNDGRLSNSRTPTAHSSTHISAGSDPIPDATVSQDGLMSASDKTKLDNSTALPTVSTLVMRDTAGRFRAVDPQVAADVATKGYVDSTELNFATTVNVGSGAVIAIPTTGSVLPFKTLTSSSDIVVTANGSEVNLGLSAITTDATYGSSSSVFQAHVSVTGRILSAANVPIDADLVAGIASMRTLGTGGTQACAGNDSRLSNSRTPTGPAGGDLTGTYPNPTLVLTGVTAGTYGSSGSVPQVQFDANGRAISATNVAIAFPASVPQFEKNIIVNGAYYTTAQTAYAAAVAFAAPVVMIVGRGTSADFGDITLVAAWDTNVSIAGFGKDVSQIGTIIGTNAGGNGYAVVLSASKIKFTGITTNTTNTGSTAGAITVSGADLNVGALSATGTVSNAFGGAIDVGAGVTFTTADCRAAKTAGAFTARKSATGTTVAANNTGGIGAGGAVVLEDYVTVTTITNTSLDTPGAGATTIGNFCTTGAIASNGQGLGPAGGNVTIGKSCVIGSITNGASAAAGGSIVIGANTVTGNLDNHGASGGTGGNITIGAGAAVGTIDNRGTGGSRTITLGDGASCGTITNTGSGTKTVTLGTGAVTSTITSTGGGTTVTTVGKSAVTGAIDASSTAGTMAIKDGATTGNIGCPDSSLTLSSGATVGAISGGGTTCQVKGFGAKITGQVQKLFESSAFHNCDFSTTSGNQDCIADLNGDGAQFIDCSFMPNGTGFAINSSVPHTIVSFDSKGNGGLSGNVTISEGTFTSITATLVQP